MDTADTAQCNCQTCINPVIPSVHKYFHGHALKKNLFTITIHVGLRLTDMMPLNLLFSLYLVLVPSHNAIHA